MMMMRALTLSPSGPRFSEVPQCQIESLGEVKIRVERAALCRTDLYVAQGRIPSKEGIILGHEAAGTIAAHSPDVEGLPTGTRVVIDPLKPCHSCPDCSAGNPHHCIHFKFMGVDYDGAFADFVVIPAKQVRKIPDELSFDLATYIEPLAATLAVLAPLRQQHDASILVLGNGRIAELTAAVLTTSGFRSVSTTISPSGELYDIVIETIESASFLQNALNALKPHGLLIIKSRHPEDLKLPMLELIKKRVRIEAVHYSPFDEALLSTIESQDYIKGLLGNRWPLESFEEAFAEATQSESHKTLFSLR